MIIIDDKTRDGKLKHDIHREAAKISALSSGKIDKYEYLTGEERLPSDQRRVIEHDKFSFTFRKSIRKINRNNWRSRRKTSKDTWRSWKTIGWI